MAKAIFWTLTGGVTAAVLAIGLMAVGEARAARHCVQMVEASYGR